VAFPPEAVLHQVHPFDERIGIELRRQQFVQLAKSLLKFRMIVARLDGVERASAALELADLGQRHAIVQKVRHGDLFRLDLGIRELYAEPDAQAALLGGVERELPDGMQVEAAGTALDVAPVATDVEHVDEGQRGDFVHVPLDSFGATARGERRPVLFPGIAEKAQSPVADGLIGRRGGGDGEPAFVLIDAERALIKTIGDRGAGAEIIAIPAVRRNIGQRESRRGAEQSTAGDFHMGTSGII